MKVGVLHDALGKFAFCKPVSDVYCWQGTRSQTWRLGRRRCSSHDTLTRTESIAIGSTPTSIVCQISSVKFCHPESFEKLDDVLYPCLLRVMGPRKRSSCGIPHRLTILLVYQRWSSMINQVLTRGVQCILFLNLHARQLVGLRLTIMM